ncbi:GNAT family N-acetyltransferase [Paenibacillus sp. KACC 21273]|uniref:GNAT family N-acetyltransferase n=1 Tax=Paenibacillus sp. KACC 21273 TaxID=3025665 RepID=UPI0023653A33|nr:GNAT family N-acetyltransferase [Paenibacillus sp. KACC 21273]WDF50050.1 GNAT family N-acetyltransferase [Paenibacillus sp. KACC 21273]
MLVFTEVTEQDTVFVFEVFKSTRVEEFIMMNMPEEQLEMLMHMQFRAQQMSYQNQYPSASHQIIEINDRKAGYIITDRHDDRIRLIFIALLLDFRNQGYGTSILQQLKETTSFIMLQVAENNPARQLYYKLGFTEQEESPPYITMQWQR